MTEEISGYMLPLLDPAGDATEIERVKSDQTALAKKPRAVTPLLIPLARNVSLADLLDSKSRVEFDLDGSGLKRSWRWITPQAGWLVFDPSGAGNISSGLQMVGGVSFWVFWGNGYHALVALDDDGDAMLSGEELRDLSIWQDTNSNGIAEPGEVRS